MDDVGGDEWQDEGFLSELFRVHDEVSATPRNPNPTPAPGPSPAPASVPTPAPVPVPAREAFAAAPISYLPAAYARVSYLPAASAASYQSPVPDYSPPRELTQPLPLPLPPSASGHGDALATLDREYSPPPALSQRPTTEESDGAVVRMPGPAVGGRFMGPGAIVGAKREREAREVERLKRELNRLSKKMHDLRNECNGLKEDRIKKDLQIKAKEAEIQNLKKASGGFAGKDVCGVGTNSDQSVHVSANGALHATSTLASTRIDKSNGKLKDHTMIDNTTSTSGVLYLEECPHLEPRSVQCKEIKTIGVQTDNTWNSEHLDCKTALLERISGNLRAIWGMPTNSLLGRNLISKIIVSCSEEILALLQFTRLPDKPGTSSEKSCSLNDAISQLYDIFVKMTNEKIPMQTFLELLLNICCFENAAIVGRTLRILQKILQHLLNYGIESNRSVPSGTMFLLNHMWMYMRRTSLKTSLLCLHLVQKIY